MWPSGRSAALGPSRTAGRLRIAMVSTPYLRVPPAHYGGTELVVSDLCRALERAGHQVTLFATGDSTGASDVRALFAEPRWPPAAMTEWSHASFAASEIARGPFDVVHSHCVAMVALARICGVPMVHTMHHARDPETSAYYQRAPEVRFVAISESQRRLEVSLLRCEVVHHGLDPARYRPGEDEGYALFMGRFSACKGAHVAVDVARAAGIPVVLAGGAHEADYYRAELEPRLGLAGVTHLGEVGGEQKTRLLAGARALLFPIDWDEPFGLVMIEAMLSGTPVLAFRRGSVPEIVEEGITGHVVDTQEEMVERLRALTRFDRAACRARAVQRWSASRMAQRYIATYRRAIEDARARLSWPGREEATAPAGS